MPKHGLTLEQLEQKKSDTFFEKVRAWTNTLSSKDVRFAYFILLVYMAKKVPLVTQDQVIKNAKELYVKTNR
jgi:hypothetical protein